MTQDRFEKNGTPQRDTSDTLSQSPIGTKGAPVSGPYAPGQNGETQPAEAVRLAHYPINTGAPARR